MIPAPGPALHLRELGTGPTRLAALHGFTLHGGSFAELAALLDATVLAPDLPGHGASAHVRAGFGETARLVAAALARFAPVPLFGYSQGGRIAIGVALDHPEIVSHLVVASASPGIADPVARRIRLERDRTVAAEIERDGLERFIDRWTADPLIGTDGVDGDDARRRRDADRRCRLENRASDLAAALRDVGQGAQPHLGSRLHEVRCPVLLLSGGDDPKYEAIGRSMARSMPHAERVVIPDVAHNVLFHAPDRVASVIRSFLAIR